MALWRKKKQPGGINEGDPVGYNAVVSLIQTRLDAAASIQELQAIGLHEILAARYLDLAMVIAARKTLQTMDNVVLPGHYLPMVDIPSLSSQFNQCHISMELVGVFQVEPTAAALLAPLSADFFAVNEALQQGAPSVQLDPAQVGDGAQVGFARTNFGDASVAKLAEDWPALS